jgi:dipeptidyl aminopeptidase/acylaminoacyl peptidase
MSATRRCASFLLQDAPLNNAQKITKPLFVVQGQQRPARAVHEAEQMVATVRKNGTPVWYLIANDEGHGFAKKRNVGLPVLRERAVRAGASAEVTCLPGDPPTP